MENKPIYLNKQHPEYSPAMELLTMLNQDVREMPKNRTCGFRAPMKLLRIDLGFSQNAMFNALILELQKKGLSIMSGNLKGDRCLWIGEGSWHKAQRLANQYFEKVYPDERSTPAS